MIDGLRGLPDPRPWLDQIAQEGYFTPMEARWLHGWLDRLAPVALASARRCFLHGDIQTTNMLVRAGSLDYLAVIDWGSAGWGDPTWDFAGVPLRAVPLLLHGYRTVAALAGEGTVEARILLAASTACAAGTAPWPAAGAVMGRAPAGDAAGDYALHDRIANRCVARFTGL